jgi:hypothetical protein
MAESRDNPLVRVATDPVEFAGDLHVRIGGKVQRFGSCWADFQLSQLKAMKQPLIDSASGDIPSLRKFWCEMTKGGGKDLLATIVAIWLLLFSRRAYRIEVGAYDQRQAGEIRYIAKEIIAAADAPLNRLVASKLTIQQYRLIAHADTPGRAESTCEILTTDAMGSHGSRPDAVILNELTHVGSEAFAQTLLDNASKCPHSLVLICTNSGEIGSWQERWRDMARESNDWHVSVLNRPAPWISESDLLDSQRRNAGARHARLFHGVWSSGEGDGLNPADIAACTTLTGPQAPRGDRVYVAGLDLGINRDHSAFAILAADPRRGMVELAALRSWNPADYGGRVDLVEICYAVKSAHQLYRFIGCKYDFWQAELMAQELIADGVPMSETKLNAEDLNLITRSLLDAFSNRRIALYPHADLTRDLLRLRVKETLQGYKLTAIRDDSGHADRAMAMALALPAGLYEANQYQPQRSADEVLYA